MTTSPAIDDGSDRKAALTGTQRDLITWMTGAVWVSALAFIWSHRALPLQDLPDWVTQGKLFADLLQGKPSAAHPFNGVPVPNAIATVCIGFLSLVVNPELAGKLLLSGYVLLYPAAALYLLSAARPRPVPPGLVAVSLALLLNFSFFHGELNYALALTALFASQGYVLRRTTGLTNVDAFRLGLATILIYFCHGAAYGAWLMFLVAYAWHGQNVRLKLFGAVLPSLLLCVVYIAHKKGGPAPIVEGWSFSSLLSVLGDKAWLVLKFTSPLQGFYPFIDSSLVWLFVGANIIILAVAVGALSRRLRRLRSSPGPHEKIIRTSLALYGLAIVLAPQDLGGLVNPAERLVLPAVQLLLVGLACVTTSAPNLTAGSRAGWALLAVQALWLHVYGGMTGQAVASVEQKLREYARRPLTVVYESHFQWQGHPHPARPWLWKRLPMHFPLLRVTYYASLEANQPVALFETGLFRSSRPFAPNSTSEVAKLSMREPILIVGRDAGNRAIASMLPGAGTNLEIQDPSFIVVKPAKSPATTTGQTAETDP